MNKSVLASGGSIAGMISVSELANSSFKLYLTGREAATEEKLLPFCCKAADVCSKCSVCSVPQKLKELAVRPESRS